MNAKLLTPSFVLGTFALLSVLQPSQAVGAVGFFNLQLEPGLQLIANQLRGQDNSIEVLFQRMPDGMAIYKFVDGSFTTNNWVAEQGWDDPAQLLEPGEGAFVLTPTDAPVKVGFAGEILMGDLTNAIPAGLSIKSSIIPKAGRLTADLGLTLSPFDNLYKWKKDHFEVFTFLPGGGWHPSEPKVETGESFFINASQQTDWVIHINIKPAQP